MKRLLIAVLLLSGVVFAKGGGGGGGGGPGGRGGGGGPGGGGGGGGPDQSQSQNKTGSSQRPDSTQMAKKIMTSYDVDKDGVLSQDELTQAMEEIQMDRTQKLSQGGQSGQRSESQDAGELAAMIIEKYSSDQKGLTTVELTKALRETARQQQSR